MSPPQAPIRLLISDVDGTLVNKQKALPAGNRDAILKLKDIPLPFTLISARPPSGLFDLATDLAIDLPMAAFNGGILFTADGTILKRHLVDAEVVRGLFDLIDGQGPTPWLFANDHWYARDPHNPHVAHERIASAQEPIIRNDFVELYGQVDKLTFVSDDALLLKQLAQKAIDAFGDQATIAQSQTYYLDITAPLANKGDGVAALAEMIFTPLTQVAVMGDMFNDLPMFARAGVAIAMGQAPEEVRSKATYTSTSNDEDGVANAIHHFILPELVGP